ncbi:MAG: Eco57I restriction-modification methylase domain-containing protein [Anaerolineae bacterium]|nr:Eco57I restriction-modification methylase domain-containing protein [Anaerolineae bacterium]
MTTHIQQRVYDLLCRMPTDGLNAVKRLFWTELNYDRANEPLSIRGWPERVGQRLDDTPLLLAQHTSSFGSFDIIYARLAADQRGRDHLSLIAERRVIDQLLPNHPYALFVFSDVDGRHWHLVNVKVDAGTAAGDAADGTPARRSVFRRISVGPYERLRTAAERMAMLDVADLDPELFGISPLAIQQRHDEAFDVEAVTRHFFTTYRRVFEQVEASLAGLDGDAERRLFTQRLFNRLLFLAFLERKGWLSLDGDPDYLHALWTAHQAEKKRDPQANFARDRLHLLFFAGLNTTHEVDVIGINRGGFLQGRIGQVPYLNGGLFEEDDLDRGPARVPDAVWEPIFDDLLYHYNFTVTESTPLDIEVAVDPEMLGKIFEELVTGRHESGSYYTPKPIVAFMGQEALRGYLEMACPDESPETIAAFCAEHDAANLRDPERVLSALRRVKICDPACGSGAYLLGMLHELFDLRAALFSARHVDPLTAYQRKLEIIQNNLYGVDIDPFAINIARLRLWLSLIVEFETDAQHPSPPPLPNLEFKIEVGDSLTAPDPTGGLQPDMFRQQQVAEFFRLKGEYLQAHGGPKLTLRQEIDALRGEIAAWASPPQSPPLAGGTAGGAGSFDWAVDFAEVFAPHPAPPPRAGEGGDVPIAGGGGFDIVLANPPYVRQELLGGDYKARLKSLYPEVYSGIADLYVYFYARALQLLKPGGMLAFISSNKWMRAGYGEKLRALLGEQTALHTLIDFGDLPIFAATAYPMIVVLRNHKPAKEQALKALAVDDLEAADHLAEIVPEQGWLQAQDSLRSKGWTLVRSTTLSLVEKLRIRGITLGKQVDGRFYRGIVTGSNKAFVVDQTVRDQLLSTNPASIEIIKPWIRGRDLRRWQVERQGWYLLYVPWELEIKDYSAIYEHLKQYEQTLANRPEVQEGRFPWYALSRYAAQYVDDFVRPKIIYPHFNTRPNFSYDETGAFSNDKTYIIPNASHYLLGVLNSKIVEFFLRQICPSVQQGYMEFRTIYVEQIPIPTPTNAQRAAIEALVRKLLHARGQGPNVAQWEQELNALVYRVYGLAEEEIEIIESQT